MNVWYIKDDWGRISNVLLNYITKDCGGEEPSKTTQREERSFLKTAQEHLVCNIRLNVFLYSAKDKVVRNFWHIQFQHTELLTTVNTTARARNAIFETPVILFLLAYRKI
jgi:hypothetical protein